MPIKHSAAQNQSNLGWSCPVVQTQFVWPAPAKVNQKGNFQTEHDADGRESSKGPPASAGARPHELILDLGGVGIRPTLLRRPPNNPARGQSSDIGKSGHVMR